MAGLGWQELMIILVILMLLFGGKRLPQLASGLGKSIREFKRGVADADSDEARLEETHRRERLNTEASNADVKVDNAPG